MAGGKLGSKALDTLQLVDVSGGVGRPYRMMAGVQACDEIMLAAKVESVV